MSPPLLAVKTTFVCLLEQFEGTLLARPLPGKSGAVFSLVQANGMFCIPHNEEGKEAGRVEVILF